MSDFNKMYQLMSSLKSNETKNYTIEDIRKEVEIIRDWVLIQVKLWKSSGITVSQKS